MENSCGLSRDRQECPRSIRMAIAVRWNRMFTAIWDAFGDGAATLGCAAGHELAVLKEARGPVVPVPPTAKCSPGWRRGLRS